MSEIKVNKENNSDAKHPTVDDYIPMDSTANFKVKMSSELVKNYKFNFNKK